MAQIASQSPKTTAASDASIILRAIGVERTFKMGSESLRILRQLDFTLRTGEFVAIEGRSGSGKSTLLHILGALDGADSGSIQYRGKDIASMNGVERSRLRNTEFGFVFQFYHLLPELNVLENSLLSAMIHYSWIEYRRRKSELRDHAVDVLKQLGMEHRLTHRPSELSGGERQRVAIARALMNKPKVLFADEPTGNLDYETGRQIMRVLEGLHQERGQTIVMVTHDRSLASEADRALVLRGGKLEKPDSPPPADKTGAVAYH